MIFIFTILLIQTYIHINYYYDKNHANSTVITQYVEIALNNKSTVLCLVLLFCTGLEWVSVVVLYFNYIQISQPKKHGINYSNQALIFWLLNLNVTKVQYYN